MSRTLTGTVTLQEGDVGKPFEAGTVAIISVVEVSLADARSVTLGSTKLLGLTGFPFNYSVNYTDQPVGGRPIIEVALQVRIETNGQLVYITDTRNLVYGRGEDFASNLNVVVRAVN